MAMDYVTDIPIPPARPDDGHKGTFGTVVVIGGCPTMIGAPAMVATGAFRAGAGLVKILTRADVLPFVLGIEASATGIAWPDREDDGGLKDLLAEMPENVVLAVGPGMGVGDHSIEVVRVVLQSGIPTVLDADGLNSLAVMEEGALIPEAPLVLTPHPGEFRRLAQESGIEADPTDPQHRPDAAAALASRYRAVVVLKGQRTVVCDGTRCYINHTGNAALASAGTGDVLTGMIAGLMAQRMEAFDAAALGVYLHGRAAELWAEAHGEAGLLARELAGLIPDVLEAHRCIQ